VIRTQVGYAGGTTPNPTYDNIGDYSETVQVDYDPTQISYERLLDAFWHSHDPTTGIWSTQYRSVIFYHTRAQETTALESKEREEVRLGRKIQTAISPYTGFYPAEDYHQKYYLRESVLFNDISSIYPDTRDLVKSTAAARLNGYIVGYGDKATVEKQLDQLGLSEEGKTELLKIIERGLSPVCPVP
jgi:peptide-methionine (S)-S-oxide reductase